MALTVIPSSVAGLMPANGATANVGNEAIAGEFAALLSGELLGLMSDNQSFGEESVDERLDSASLAEQMSTGDPGKAPPLLSSLFESIRAAGLANAPADFKSISTAGFANEPADAAPDGATALQLLSQTQSSNRTSSGNFGRELRDSITATTNGTDVAQQPTEPTALTARNPAGLSPSTEKNQQPITFGNQATTALRPPTANIAGESRSTTSLPAATSENRPVESLPTANSLSGHGINPATRNLEHPAVAEQRPAVNAHLHSAAWPQQFGDKIVWLARNDQQSAQLIINPPQLGPIQISLNLSGDQASIAFASPHAEVRQAIESAMPQLKEMLSSAGISLGQSNVGGNLHQQPADNPFADANGKRSVDENAILPANDNAANAAGSAVLHRGRGLVDLFA